MNCGNTYTSLSTVVDKETHLNMVIINIEVFKQQPKHTIYIGPWIKYCMHGYNDMHLTPLHKILFRLFIFYSKLNKK